MTREEAIESFNHSNEQAKVRLVVEKMRMDISEVKELEFYIERDEMAIEALEKEPKWIPVSERLPEESKKCLVTFRGGYVGIMCYAPDLYRVDEYDFCDEKGMAGWYDYDRELGHYSRDDVIAWMPLPTPYKAESEDKE